MSVDTPALTFAPIDADDQPAVDAAYDIDRAAQAVDIPDLPPQCRYHHEMSLRVSWPGRKFVRRLAYLDGRPVGTLAIEFPQLDNLHNASVELFVHPDWRRHGVGRALLNHALQVARREGRQWLMGMSVGSLPGGPSRDPAGSAFATAMGFKHALGDVRRRLDLATVDTVEHDRLLADARQRAEGYSLVQWMNTTPEEHVEDIAALDSTFLEQTPTGELAIEAEKVDADRVRRSDQTRTTYGIRSYQTGLRHDASGVVVAWSALAVTRTIDWHAWQHITLVHHDHRGHRLGMLSKVANLRHLLAHEPALRVVDTWNADVNTHMIAINEAMGFRPVDAWANWQRAL